MTTERADPAADLADATMAWTDRWYDDALGLVWLPPDPEPDGAWPAPRVHLLPQSSWYAAGLLARGRPGDHERAVRVLHAVVDRQYDEPGTAWHGTFWQWHESPHPGPDAVMWDDYDPNWRQFIGCTLLLALRHFEDRLPTDLVARIDASLRLAVDGEPDRRIPDSYANIALMHAYVEVEVGRRLGEPMWVERGEARAIRVHDRYERSGAFDEYNSPTYYGIDLLALGLWRGHSSSEVLTRLGTAMEAALWRDSVRWYHAGLRNVVGPYTRSYGMDLGRYVGAWSMWVWAVAGRPVAPLPALDGPLAHGIDVMLGPLIAVIGAVAPDDCVPALAAFAGERLVEQRISPPDDGDRVATAWLAERVMLGAERNTIDLSWWDQFHAATAHWRRPDGSLGWLRAVVPGPSDTTVEPGRLTIRWHHEHEGVARFELDRPGSLDGVTLTSDGPAPIAEGSSLVAQPGPGATTTFTIQA